MNASPCMEHIFVDHSYQLHRTRHRSCYWPNEDNLAVHRMESGVTIKAEPPDEDLEFQSELAAENIQMEESVDDFFPKHKCGNFEEGEAMLRTDNLDSVKNEYVVSSPPCCEDVGNWLNDDFFPLNVVKEEVIIKIEPNDFEEEKMNSVTFIKEEFEDRVGNQSNNDYLGFTTIKQEITIKGGGEDFSEQLELRSPENEELIVKDEIFAEPNFVCVEEIIATNLKKKLNLISRLEQHKYDASHTGEKPCKLHELQHSGCEKPSGLKEPQHAHENLPKCNREVAYRCSACNYKSPKKWLVYRHLNIHKKKILHKCNKCEYSSLDGRLFHQHLATHTKAFKCTKCKYRASRQQYLNVHLKTHVNSHYKCNECEYTATQRSTVTRHFNAVHLNV